MESDWASLPAHLLDSILKKLEPLEDYLRFSATCTKWNSVAKHNQSQRMRMKMLTHQLPMLLVPSEDNHSHRVYNVLANDFSKSKLVVPYDKRFAGSSLGWLVAVEDDFSVKLYKPFSMVEGEIINSNATIRLPPIFPPEHADMHEYHVFKASLSADPIISPDDCIVVAIFSTLCNMAFIRPSKDATWTRIEGIQWPIDEVLYFKDQFYALSCRGDLVSFKISATHDSSNLDIKLAARKPRRTVVGKSYLVKTCDEKLLNVVRFMSWRFFLHIDENILDEDDEVMGRTTTRVIIYELDFDKGRWFRIYSLGDQALFLGDNTSICVLASNYPGCKPNCIYFTHDEDSLRSGRFMPCDLGMYDLANRAMEYFFGIEDEDLNQMTRLPIWVVPTLNE